MDLDQYFKFMMALLFVVALIMAVAWLLRRAGLGAGGGGFRAGARQRRLGVVEALALDAKRRLVLVRRDDREHLILLSATGDLLIDSGPSGAFDAALARQNPAQKPVPQTPAPQTQIPAPSADGAAS